MEAYLGFYFWNLPIGIYYDYINKSGKFTHHSKWYSENHSTIDTSFWDYYKKNSSKLVRKL